MTTKQHTTELGLFSDFSAYGDEMHVGWGALIGGGFTSAGMLLAKGLTRKSSKWSKYAGGVGILAGGLPAAVMLFFPRTRRAGYLALAVSAIEGLTELIKDIWIEPRQLAGYNMGLYQPEMTDGLGADDISILGDMEYGEAPLQILGETTPAQALGAYQTEMTGGASPLDVMGGGAVQPYSGHF